MVLTTSYPSELGDHSWVKTAPFQDQSSIFLDNWQHKGMYCWTKSEFKRNTINSWQMRTFCGSKMKHSGLMPEVSIYCAFWHIIHLFKPGPATLWHSLSGTFSIHGRHSVVQLIHLPTMYNCIMTPSLINASYVFQLSSHECVHVWFPCVEGPQCDPWQRPPE